MHGTGEFAIVAKLRDRFPLVGDDCAVVDGLLLAADAVAEGVHFAPGTAGADVGWRASVANVSDVAAMGGRPRWLLATVSAPQGADVEGVLDGIAEAADAYGCELAGGDLTGAATLVVSVAVVGAVDGSAVLRSGARPGDDVWVTAPLGASAASDWTRRPSARVEEGTAARLGGATAMIDISDGLAADLGHLAEASGVGFALDEVPVADGATLEHALHGGEDFELVFAAPPGSSVPGIRIGTCVADPSVRTLRGEPLVPAGWEHRW